MNQSATYDAFLSYNSLDATTVLRVAEELRKRGCKSFLDRQYLEPGRDWVDALERALGTSRAVAMFLGPHDMGRWQLRERAWALDRQAGDPQFAVIPVLLPGSQPPLGFLKQLMWIDLREDPQSGVQLDRLAAAIRGESIAAEGTQHPRFSVCPYRGLLYFREEDAAFFFGRDVYVQQLLAKVAQRTLVAVVGASGSGKSSVVRAGLVPRLRACDREEVWEIVTIVPGENPLHALAEAVTSLIEPDLQGVDLVRKRNLVAEDLQGGRVPLWDYVAEALRRQTGTDRLLLVVDQWEELYTQCEDAVVRERFIEQLLAATARKQSPLSVVFTIRDDFYGRLLQHRPLMDQLGDGRVDLSPMTRDELREAIERPATEVGLEFEPGLVDALLNEANQEPGRLALLEFALKELWKRHERGKLTHAAYGTLGRLSGAIATHAETVYLTLTPAEQAAVPGLVRRLVRAGSKTEEDTRRRADLRSLDEASQRVVRVLADPDHRLLVTTRVETAGENGEATVAETVEVAHEELLRRWSRLGEWVNADRKFLQWRARLAPLLEQYGRDPESALLRFGALREAGQFYPERQSELEQAENQFLSASFAAEKRRRRTVWGWIGASVAALVVIAVGVGLTIRNNQNKETVNAAVRNLPQVVPTNVPGVLTNLRLLPEYAARELTDRYQKEQDPEAKRRLAYGLIAVKRPKSNDPAAQFLIESLADASPADSSNLVEALSQLTDRDEVIQQLMQYAGDALQQGDAKKTRYVTAAFSLGQVHVLEPVRLSKDGDPTPRTRFIKNFPNWPGDVTRIGDLLPQIENSEIRSAVCLAIGGVDAESRTTAERMTIEKVLIRLYQEADDPGTHSAAGWALREWQVRPPELPRLANKIDQERFVEETKNQWYVNSLGMTMVRIPESRRDQPYHVGSRFVDVNPPRAVAGSEFWLSQCEVTVEQFQKLIPERQLESTPEPDSPMYYITWFDALHFCNLLSQHEGRTACYHFEGERDGKEQSRYKGSIMWAEVKIMPGNGYRLPREVEWEIACRGGTQTEYYFGNVAEDLGDYGWFYESKSGSKSIARKRPNHWGLHDMHGNLSEWCEDLDADNSANRVARGGGWNDGAVRCRSAYRFRDSPGYQDYYLGFRVALSSSGK